MNSLDRRVADLLAQGRHRAGDGQGLAAIAPLAAAQDPDRIIVIEGERSLSRAEMLDLALRLGGGLLARGITPGAAIAFQLPNWWEACVLNLTAALFGYRLVPLLTIYRTAELNTILPACAAEVLFIPGQFRNIDFAATVAALDHVPRHVFTVRGSDPGFDALLRTAPARPVPPAGTDAKMVLFTSGSTGRPKGVIHSHAGMEVLIRRMAAFWQIDQDDVLYVPSPVGHVGGSLYAFEFPWITGCTAVLAESWEPRSAVARMAALHVTFMAGATPFLQGLIAASAEMATPLPALRRFICGGASVTPELVQRGLAAFPAATVSRAYGSTEVPLAAPGLRDRASAMLHADTDGTVDVELRFLDPDGHPQPDAGEVALRGPQMFLGYLDPADDVDAFTPDGFFRMGDLGQRVGADCLRITGRIKDIIIRKGENISPLEIETALLRHPAVRLAAVVGTPDPERGEMLVAFVVPQPGAAFDMQIMADHLHRLGLARQKCPERLECLDSLPLNTIGKVQKAELRQMLAPAQTPGATGEPAA